jgi:hypothetical protein
MRPTLHTATKHVQGYADLKISEGNDIFLLHSVTHKPSDNPLSHRAAVLSYLFFHSALHSIHP